MNTLHNATTIAEPRPATRPAPVETIPANPNDPNGVSPAIIEEIEEIGRKYNEPRK
jgi:hypothetical protein